MVKNFKYESKNLIRLWQGPGHRKKESIAIPALLSMIERKDGNIGRVENCWNSEEQHKKETVYGICHKQMPPSNVGIEEMYVTKDSAEVGVITNLVCFTIARPLHLTTFILEDN